MIHHVIPLSRGGRGTVPLCEPCHAKVHDISADAVTMLRAKKKKMIQDNLYTGGRPPYGMANRAGKLVRNKQELALITRVRQLIGSGMRVGKIAKLLNDEGQALRKNASWSSCRVTRLARGHSATGGHSKV